MALARYEQPIQDAAGNLITTPGFQFEVRREDVAGNPKKPIYSDRAGVVPLGNPASLVDGVVAFHAAGGPFRLRVYGPNYDETWDYRQIGTGAEVDADQLLIPGYLFEFETGTTAPPGDGGIRANNANLSLANRLFIWKSTVAGSDVSDRIEALLGKRALLTSTNAGEQVSVDVDAVTDQSTYYELVISQHEGATSIPAGRVGLQREGSEGPAGLNGVFNGTELILTGATETLIAAYKGNTVICNRTGTMTLALDAAATLGADWQVMVKNTGTGNVTIDPNGAETIDGAATLVLRPGDSIVVSSNGTVIKAFFHAYVPGKTDVAIADGGTGSSTADAALIALGLPSYFPNHLSGLTLSNNVTDATNDIDIDVGAANDSGNTDVMKRTSALTKRLDASWAVGNNNGGRDTGSIADGTWHVWLIKRPDTGVVDVLFSLSATAPTMPSNYTLKRRIGSIVRVGGVIKPFKQVGDYFYWQTGTQDVSASPGSTAAQTATLTVPSGIVVLAKVTVGANDGATSSDNYLLVTVLDQADAPPSVTNFTLWWGSANTTHPLLASTIDVATNTSGQIRWRTSTNSGSVSYRFNTIGWTDTRGK